MTLVTSPCLHFERDERSWRAEPAYEANGHEGGRGDPQGDGISEALDSESQFWGWGTQERQSGQVMLGGGCFPGFSCLAMIQTRSLLCSVCQERSKQECPADEWRWLLTDRTLLWHRTFRPLHWTNGGTFALIS